MSLLRFRLYGNEDQSATVIAQLHGIDHVERIEEVADQMRGMRDDSSSLGLPDDQGSGLHCVELVTRNHADPVELRGIVERVADELGVGVEFVDRF